MNDGSKFTEIDINVKNRFANTIGNNILQMENARMYNNTIIRVFQTEILSKLTPQLSQI